MGEVKIDSNLFYFRRPLGQTSFIYRCCHGLCTKERLELRRIRKLLFQIRCIHRSIFEDDTEEEADEEEEEHHRSQVKALLMRELVRQYLLLSLIPKPERLRRVHMPRTIGSFSETECWSRFRTRIDYFLAFFVSIISLVGVHIFEWTTVASLPTRRFFFSP